MSVDRPAVGRKGKEGDEREAGELAQKEVGRKEERLRGKQKDVRFWRRFGSALHKGDDRAGSA